MKRPRKVQLVDDWRDGWRWFSAWLTGLPAFAVGIWALVPESMRDQVPDRVVIIALGVCALLALIGRFIKQALLRESPDGDAGPSNS